MTDKTRSQEAATDVAALLRARNPLLWIVTREEARVERYLVEAAAAAGYMPRLWDVSQGATTIDGKQMGSNPLKDPGDALGAIAAAAAATGRTERGAWIMRDLPVWISGPAGTLTNRQLRNLARSLPGTPRETAQAVIIITPSTDVPPELAGHTTVIEWPMPDRAEIAAILDAAIESLPMFENDPATGQPDPSRPLRALAAPNGTRDAAIDAAIGLSGEEAQACYARSLVQARRIDPAMVAKEKRRVIARERVLEWHDPLPGGLDAVGGLDVLKAWLIARSSAYSPAARAYGLPSPKGALLVGVPGCGKSLLAKTVPTAWGVPLLRLDLGALKGKFMGESEGNLRKAFRVIEAIGRCVVWIDEIEKALAGSVSGASDGGVAADALGGVLSWMQERAGEAFVIATANDVEGLPPELLRKGRFDEVFYVDLPTPWERLSVLQAALTSHGRGGCKDINMSAINAHCDGFTGSEVASLVPDALFAGFADGAREITTEDLIAAAKTVVPLSRTAEEKIAKLREWASTRARKATSPTPVPYAAQTAGRVLDI